MKKQLLLVLSLLLLPVFANAQTADDLSAWWHNIEAAVQTAVQKKIDRFLDSDWAKGIERFSRAYNKVSSEAGLRWKERSNPPFSIQNIPVPARGTLGRFIYDKTETALERFTENHVIVYSWLAKLHFEIELSKTPKEAVRNYAQKRAYITTSNLLEDLRSSPFDIHPAVTDELSRGALEYQLCILESGGLEACEEEYRAKYGERKIQEFENILEVRKKWVYYMEKNPIFKYYVLNRDFSVLQSLSKQEYETLLAFFSGKELPNGWQYRTPSRPVLTMVNADGYLLRCSGSEDGTGGVNVEVNSIYVKISDQLVVEISPEILYIDIYREDLTTDYQRSLNWKSSKNL